MQTAIGAESPTHAHQLGLDRKVSVVAGDIEESASRITGGDDFIVHTAQASIAFGDPLPLVSLIILPLEKSR